MTYNANNNRYDSMKYNRCGESGIQLSAISLGLWHNFGEITPYEKGKEMIYGAFDIGITQFDLANNYGPPAGSAETTFGKILKDGLKPYRDEIVITTKAGYYMWPGSYGDGGSKKYLVSSLDQSLQRMGLDYVDIFYHHRPDSNTPLEETMDALAQIVRQGKALYVGISNYSAKDTARASKILKSMGSKCLVHQNMYSMFKRDCEKDLFKTLEDEKIGCVAFSPLAQGMLTDKYIKGIPKDSRAAGPSVFLGSDAITQSVLNKTVRLNEIAQSRNQTLAQMALAWDLRQSVVASVIIGASRLAQIKENVEALQNLDFSKEELNQINNILSEEA